MGPASVSSVQRRFIGPAESLRGAANRSEHWAGAGGLRGRRSLSKSGKPSAGLRRLPRVRCRSASRRTQRRAHDRRVEHQESLVHVGPLSNLHPSAMRPFPLYAAGRRMASYRPRRNRGQSGAPRACLAQAVPLPDYFGQNWDALWRIASATSQWLDRPQAPLGPSGYSAEECARRSTHLSGNSRQRRENVGKTCRGFSRKLPLNA